ncbi:MAG: SBBP repeat-containing protein [Candidatus Hodarchaeales archaeon]|jgi:hypothetical protein
MTKNTLNTLLGIIFALFLLLAICGIVFPSNGSMATEPAKTRKMIVFSTYFGGNASEWDGGGMIVDPLGNIIVTGVTESTDFPLKEAINSNQSEGNLYLAKFSPTGNILFSTFLNGENFSHGADIALDSTGNIIIGGHIDSDGLALVNAYQEGYNGTSEAFIMKLAPDGQSTIFSTYLGGNDSESILGISIDNSDNILVAGKTKSADFPVTANAFQNTSGGSVDIFVSKFSPDGQALLYSTYLGGNETEDRCSIAVDDDGSFVIGGETRSQDFPVDNAHQNGSGGNTDGFLAKFSAEGTLQFSTYLGDYNVDQAKAVAISDAGNIIVAGTTSSRDFPTTVGVYQEKYQGSRDAFISEFSNGGELLASTFLGDYGGDEDCNDVKIAENGEIIVAGFSGSRYFPIVDAVDPYFSGAMDSFLAILSPDFKDLRFSTYYGGSETDSAENLAIDHEGDLVVTGITVSSDFPPRNAYQSVQGGGTDVFIYKVTKIPLYPESSDSSSGFAVVSVLLGLTCLIIANRRKTRLR